MEQLISHNNRITTNFQNFIWNIADWLRTLLNRKVTPDFQKIEKKWYESKNWPLNTQVYYSVDDQIISEELFYKIASIIGDTADRKENDIWEMRIEKTKALYASSLKDKKTIIHINDILKQIP